MAKKPLRSTKHFLFIVLLLSVGGGINLACAKETTHAPLRPNDILSAPTKYLGQEVEILIVEPLSGPGSKATLATTTYGQVRIMVPDAPGMELSLVPATFRMENPNRYKQKFDRVLLPPLKVKGELFNDEEMAKAYRRPYYVLRVSSLEALPPPTVKTLHSLKEAQSDPASWDRQSIVYEGDYVQGFEVSSLDGKVWLQFDPRTEIIGKAPQSSAPNSKHRIRVTGTLFAKPGAHYGHLGGYEMEILVRKLEYINDSRDFSP